jgi:cell division initiation protein
VIAPEDIDVKQFTIRMRGYDQNEVDAFLDEVTAEYRRTLNDLYLLRGQSAAATDAVALLSAAQKTHDSTVAEANTTAGKILSQAEREADLIVDTARKDAHAVIGELEEQRRRLKGEIALLRSVRQTAADRMKKCLESISDDE